MTEAALFLICMIGPVVAFYLNTDVRKKYLCLLVVAICVISNVFFALIENATELYWSVAALELIGVAGILRSFHPPQWKNEGYLLVICGLVLLSAWNTLFYIYSSYFTLYANLADWLAILTVAWMIGRSDGVIEYFAGIGNHFSRPMVQSSAD